MRGADRSSPLTVRGWQNLVLIVMGVVVLLGAASGAVLLRRYDAVTRELSERVQPARIAAYRLQAALRDQETSVRGYVVAADPSFLEPYQRGRRDEDRAASEIRTLLGGYADPIADLDDLEAAATAWRTSFAEPVIAGVRPGSPRLLDPGLAERGKVQFDALRTLFDDQNDGLTAARESGMAHREDLRGWRDVVFVAELVAFFAAAVLLAVLTRNAVTRPLEMLARACRRITAGDFGEQIEPRGPKDIRAIASDVENMRQRIAAELSASQEAGALLARQAAVLDEQAIELRRSNAELEQFAYVASHDLQEPLRKVTSFCQLLEKRYTDALDDRGREYIAYAVDGAKRMQVLINDLLAFSRVGRVHGAGYAEVSLDDTLDTALANLGEAIEESGARVERPPGGLPMVVGDPMLLGMLWQNLLGNAMKFRSPDRPPQVVLAVEETPQGHRITVSDNGIGIGPEFVDKVFVIFQRLHGRDAYGGTGIGLAMCKKIVEYHGGTIWIDTDYTGGTRFVFTLPPPDSRHASAAATPLTEGHRT